MKRRICVFTGTRAEYGILRPLLAAVRDDRGLALQLVVSGTHLARPFGLTYREILEDGFRIDEKVDIRASGADDLSVAASMGLGIARYARSYRRLRPDILVLLGDRYELLSAAAAALVCRVPIAHIGGGDVTEGVLDDSFRHAITKMSHLHFAATRRSRDRIVQLGESPGRVFEVGEIGLDGLAAARFMTRHALERDLGVTLRARTLLVTLHPVTLEPGSAAASLKALLRVLDELEDGLVVFTKANADSGGRELDRMIDAYVSRRPGRAAAFASLGRHRYLSLMRHCLAVVGNSSSGIVEAPSLRVATVDIGDRQRGRERAASVLACRPDAGSIRRALRKACSAPFQASLKLVKNPYGDGRSVPRVVRVLKRHPLANLLKKRFFDLPLPRGLR
ncbi:MAG: UDP-N-acetylglucosamine 2-epimerase (hydrolyzing) [Elusimicrobia bacterium]|nr:UDP-N-acetylglucosamine 2-epimerase (hydrolyzing) [Elusimicrobiota bacterium]